MSDAVGSISHIQQQAADWLNNSDDEEDDEDIERIAKDAHEVVHQIIYGVGHN